MSPTSAPDGRPIVFHDLPEAAFPFTVKRYNAGGKMIFSETIREPAVLEIPPLGTGGYTVVEFADGTVFKVGA